MNRKSIIVLALWAGIALLPAPAIADGVYEDSDSDYLKVTSFIVEPVGQLLEWIVFRPMHALHHAISPPESLQGRPRRLCTGLRPARGCSRR